MTTINRRKLLLSGAIIGIGSFSYAYNRGIRYPRFGLEPEKLAVSKHYSNTIITVLDGIFTKNKTDTVKLRAIAPEPSVEIEFIDAGELTLSINNIAANAELKITGSDIKLVDEDIKGITRFLTLQSRKSQTVKLDWSLPEANSFTFSVIGDSGGNGELLWCIKRSKEIGAQFLLHLGDFNYTDGDYILAIDHFKNASIPVYVSIGNHDFNNSGLVYRHFLNNIGPMNNAFTLGGTRFINMDTAADFFPVNSGHRSRFFKQLAQASGSISDQVAFTHRPFENAAPGGDIRSHVAGSQAEVSWLKKSLKNIGCNTLLAGHVHHSDERDVDGIQQWTAGEGLGHKDIVRRKPVSKFLIGHVEKGKRVNYSWQKLDMPWAYHNNAYQVKILRKGGYKKHADWLEETLRKEASPKI